ncbi:MAG: hypothetical protein AAGC79_05010 [Pseudomonadota bacterium]
MKPENQRVVVHDMRGFVADDLRGAFQESYAISQGTKCRQHLFSLSLKPPKDAKVDPAAFEDAVDRAEKALGLDGQPRAIVFHEKRGADGEIRRHAHAVWCRIDVEEMKARQLSFSKTKLQALARASYVGRTPAKARRSHPTSGQVLLRHLAPCRAGIDSPEVATGLLR